MDAVRVRSHALCGAVRPAEASPVRDAFWTAIHACVALGLGEFFDVLLDVLFLLLKVVATLLVHLTSQWDPLGATTSLACV